MGRKRNEETNYKVTVHKVRNYYYARLQQSYQDKKTGKTKRKDIVLGTLDSKGKFFPGEKYWELPEDERTKLIFPDYWNWSETEKFSNDNNKLLYGNIWLLEQIADVTGIKEDLNKVFQKNNYTEIILTLAMYLIISKGTPLPTLINYQYATKFPFSDPLTYPEIKRFLRYLTDEHRKKLLSYRRERVPYNCELCAVEYMGNNHCENVFLYGSKFFEDYPLLAKNMKVVVYDTSNQLPVFYQSYSKLLPDSSSFQAILESLKENNFNDHILITERGYENLPNYVKFLKKSQHFITHIKTNEKEVENKIKLLNKNSSEDNKADSDKSNKTDSDNSNKLIYCVKKSQDQDVQYDFNLNLYYDDSHKAYEQKCIDSNIELQHNNLTYYKKKQKPLDDNNALNQLYNYYTLNYDKNSRILLNFTLNEKKIQSKRNTSGYFAFITQNLNKTAEQILPLYNLINKQKKYYNMIKDTIAIETIDEDIQSIECGALLIMFVVQILDGYLNHVFETTDLNKTYHTVSDVLNKMESIKYVKKKNSDEGLTTEFTYTQQEICKLFGFNIPQNFAEED